MVPGCRIPHSATSRREHGACSSTATPIIISNSLGCNRFQLPAHRRQLEKHTANHPGTRHPAPCDGSPEGLHYDTPAPRHPGWVLSHDADCDVCDRLAAADFDDVLPGREWREVEVRYQHWDTALVALGQRDRQVDRLAVASKHACNRSLDL